MGIVLQGCNCIVIGGCLSGWISITIHHCIVTIVQFWLELYCNTADCIARVCSWLGRMDCIAGAVEVCCNTKLHCRLVRLDEGWKIVL